MVYLLDTNIIIRFLVGDNEKFLEQSTEYFNQIDLFDRISDCSDFRKWPF